jgi:hypothetical protein
MHTALKRTRDITTRDRLVTGGDSNPLNPGGRRRVWKVNEAFHATTGLGMREGYSSFRATLLTGPEPNAPRDPSAGQLVTGTILHADAPKLRVIA